MSINQEITGQGFPLVIMHGLFGDIDNFRSIASPLENHFQVIRLDLPSHGESSRLAKISIEAMAEAVTDHLAEEGITHFHLMGHSLGGKVAMQMAGGEPKGMKIEKLLVVDIAPRLYPPHHEDILDALQSVSLADLKSRSSADKQLKPYITNAGVRGFLLKSLYKNDAGNYDWRFDLNAIRADYDAIRQIPSFTKQVDSPTLFIKGGESDYILAEDEPAIRTHFKHPEFKVIEGTGHWLHAEKPEIFARLCLNFLQKNA